MLLRRYVLAGVFACVFLAGIVTAQSSKPCAIMGTVFDASRTPLAGVRIEATSDTGEQPRAITTDADGKFQFTELPSGTYTVTVSYPEYQTFKREGIYLAPGMNTSMMVTLRPMRTRN